jgi:hypothetical protein
MGPPIVLDTEDNRRSELAIADRNSGSEMGYVGETSHAQPERRESNMESDGYNPGAMKHETASGPDLGRKYEVEPSAETGTLLTGKELDGFRSTWDKVQTSFVDEPRDAVSKADELVASVVNRIAEQSASEREKLEKQWSKGEDVSTEDLRQALKRYRSFFDRLLKI